MSSQLQNIAPAPPSGTPQQMHSQPQMSQMAAPGAPSAGPHPLMSPGGHPVQQMGQQVTSATPGQYQIIQSPNGATAQYLAQPQVATYNQHGQIVLQPANFAGMQIMQAAQQPGQPQYILAAGTPQAAVPGQKPGQPQMIASSPQQPGAGKAITPISQATSGYTLTTPGIVSPATPGAAGATQTYMMANPMTGAIMGNGQPMTQIPSSMASHIKPEPGKPAPNQQQLSIGPSQGQPQPSATPHQPHLSQQAQAVMLPGGQMAYMQAQPQQQGQAQTQAIFQNGQLFFRAQGTQEGMMFSPQGQPISQQPMQVTSNQQMPPGLTPGMQPMAIQSTASMRPPTASTLPMQMIAGKTPISRSQPLLLPSTTSATSKSGYTIGSNQLPSIPSLQHPSPKSKQKISPRGSGHVGRPPGPKSALMKMASQPTPRLPGPPIIPNQPGSPRTLGPPILQTSSPIPPNNLNPPHSQPPILQPMNPLPLPPTVSVASSVAYSSANAVSKNNILSRPPTLSANIPVSQVNGTSHKLPILPSNIHPKTSDADKLKNGGDSLTSTKLTEAHVDGESNTPKAVVKPNVLTHVIDGHIIKESSTPFELDLKDRNRKKSEGKVAPNTAQINPQLNSSLPTSHLTPGNPLLFPNTGNLKPLQPSTNLNNTQHKTFDENSTLTTKKSENGGEKRGPGRPKGSTNKGTQQQSTNDIIKSKVSSDPPPLKKAKLDVVESDPPTSTGSSNSSTVDVVTNNPLKWDVTQVCDFVKNLAGCSEYVEDFQLQEIDGQALMLLKADHLMSAMSIKLGPALKICSAIEGMRDEISKN